MSDPAVESTAKETEFPAAAAPAANGASNGAADSGGLRSGSPRSTDSDSDVSFDPLQALHEAEKHLARASMVKSSAKNLSLSWENIEYSVELKDKSEKKILHGMSGTLNAGELLVIMGSSGAGKTSLLNILAGRLVGNSRMDGKVYVNNKERDPTKFRHQSAYVMQDDLVFAELTVLETVTLAAQLRLPRDMSSEEKNERVQSVIRELGLSEVADTLVGGPSLRGVSGGERKRVTIATELVTDPSIVFLDEPTSGLDSFNAQNTMMFLLRLAQSGRAVCATVHQPRSSIYQMSEKILLLSAGKVMYFGETTKAVPYFADLGFECPPSFNPADYFMDLISVDRRLPSLETKTKRRIEFLADKYNQTIGSTLPAIEAPITQSVESLNEVTTKYAASWWTQFILLSRRDLLRTVRERKTNIISVVQAIMFALLISVIWLREGDGVSGRDIQNIAGVLFFIAINVSFSGTFGIVFIFPTEAAIVKKERAGRSYYASSYFLSKTLSGLPKTLITQVLFSAVIYFIVGFREEAEAFFVFVIAIFSTVLAAEGLAYIASVLGDDPQAAGAIAPPLIVMSMLFGGFFVEISAIPVWLRWLQYLSFVRYSYSALLQNEFEGRTFETASCAGQNFCPATGDEVVDFYGALTTWGKGANIGFLLMLAVVFRVIAYLLLRRKGPSYIK